MYGMDDSPPASHQSSAYSDYPESSNTSGDGFLSWERSRQSSAYRANHLDDDMHGTQQKAAVVEDDSNDLVNDGAHSIYQQQEQLSCQSVNSQPSKDSDEKAIHSPTPFRPMAPREFALGNTLRRSRSAMPMATLPADATVARKGSYDGGTPSQSVASASYASGLSVEQSEIESLQKLIQQQQQMQTGIPPLPLQEQHQQSHNTQHMRKSTSGSMQRISETSGYSSDSFNDNDPPEQSAGQHAGGEGFQQTAGEAAGESTTEQVSDRALDRNYRQNERDEVHATGEQLNEVTRIYPVEMVDEAAEAQVAAMVESSEEDTKNQSLGYLSDDFQVYEGELTESWKQSPARPNIYVGREGNDNTILEDISDNIKGGESDDESVQNRSGSAHSEHSSHSSTSSAATGGHENVDDDENDVDDISYDIGTEMGLHSRQSVEQSDISETASERESSSSSIGIEKMTSANALDNVRQQSGTDARLNKTDGHPINHYLTSNDDEGMQDKNQSHLPAKRPLGTDATDASNEIADQKMGSKDTVSTISPGGDRFPLTSQTIAIADNADTQEASGAITARFGRLLQECRNLTETCGDDSLRDSMMSSQVESATKTSSSNFRSSTSNVRSSTTETEAIEEERRLSSSQLKAAAAMAAANSSGLQRRSYSNPVTQKHEIDTSDGKHLHMSQLTVDPALHSSMIASDFTGSMMSVSGYKDLKSSTFTGLVNSAEFKESQSSEYQSVEQLEEDPNQSEDGDNNYAETFQVPIDRPLGRRAPRPVQPMSRSIKSAVSELSVGVDVMYGDADEDTAFNKSGNLNEDLTAPFDPSRFLAELNPSSFGAGGETSKNASSTTDSPKQHGLVPSNKDEKAEMQKIETNEAAPTSSNIVAKEPSQGIANHARPSSPSYISRASSHISSDFSADEGGLLVGFGQRNFKRSIGSKGSDSSSSTSSGAFSSGSDSSSDESSSSGSSGSSSSSSEDDSDSSSDGLDNIARDGLRIQSSSRDSVSELSFGGASALMALQASRALPQYPNTPIVREEEEADKTDRVFSHSINSAQSGSKNSSSDSDQQATNDSSRSERRASLIGEVDQLEKLDEVSESTASDFLDDISSVGDNNNAVEKFFSSPTNEHETASIWSSATSTGLKNIPADKLLEDSFSSSSSPARDVNTEKRLSSPSRSSPLSSRSASPPESSRSQGTRVSGDKLETMQEGNSSSTLPLLSQNIPTQQSSPPEATKEVLNVPTITKEDVDEGAATNMTNSGSPESEGKNSSSSLRSSGSRHHPSTRWKSINSSKSNSSKSQDSASAASSGSYYKGVLARAAAMNQDEDSAVQQLSQDELEDKDGQDVMQASSYSHNLEKLLGASPSEELQQGEDQILPLRSSSYSSENLIETSPPQDDPIQIESEDEDASLHRGDQKTIGPAELVEEASEEMESDMHDDISSMSSVVSKARTSMRASFIAIEEKQKGDLEHGQFDKQSIKSSMKSRYSYDEDELYEDFPSEKVDDEEIRRNRSSASQIVSESVETDARRPWKTAAREEVAAIPDESVLSAQTGSQRSSVISGQNIPERNELYAENSDDDTNDEGSVSELFSSKEALKRMGLYSSAMNLGSEDDALSFSGASDQNQNEQVAPRGESPKSTVSMKQLPLDEESNISENDREKKVGSLRDSIRSSIQSIKEQFFGETRSNYSKSVTSGQSIGSVKELNDDGQQHQTQQSVTSNDNSDGSLSLPKSNEAEESPMKSPARMLADTAREMTALLDHSISSRSLTASKATEPDNDKVLGARKESSVSSASEGEVIAEVSPKVPKDDISTSSHSKASDDQSISIDSLDDIESRIEVFKKKNKPAVDNTNQDALRVSFANEDEEIGSQRDDDISNKNKATSTEEKEAENSAGASWWKEMLTKPRFICGSVTIAVVIILCSSIGATVASNRRSIPTSQPTPPPTRIMPNWVQVGGDLKGEMPGDEAGFSISASENGFTVVVGARRNGNSSDGTENRGAAQIFRFDELHGFYKSVWINYGDAKGDQCGFSVAMSKDGKRVAVGCPGSDTYGKNSGKVRLFMEEEMSETWVMISEFYGEGSGDLFGAAVSLSPEGTRLAVGAPYYTRNEVKRSGSAYAFREVSESVWQPSGNPMRGVVEESLFGWSVSLSPGGMFLAVGAPKMSESSLDGGFVKVFSFEAADGSVWQDYGDLITNGVPGDRFGFSVSIAGDATLQHVAVGAPGYSAIVEGGGLASLYENSGNGWSNAGDDLISDIDGENLGYAVSLTPSANRLVVGVPKKQFNGEIVGQVQVFNVDYGFLTPAGEKYGLSGEKFGVSVAISNNGKRFFGGATDANLVRAYEDFPIVNFNS